MQMVSFISMLTIWCLRFRPTNPIHFSFKPKPVVSSDWTGIPFRAIRRLTRTHLQQHGLRFTPTKPLGSENALAQDCRNHWVAHPYRRERSWLRRKVRFARAHELDHLGIMRSGVAEFFVNTFYQKPFYLCTRLNLQCT